MKNLVITNDFESDKQRVDTKNLRFSWIRKNIHKKKDKLTNQKKYIQWHKTLWENSRIPPDDYLMLKLHCE